MNIGIDHGYAAIKTRHFSFPAGITAYDHEPYTRQGLLEVDGRFYVCGTGRQPIQRDKTANSTYYLLTLAAIAMELRERNAPTECEVTLGAGLPLTSFGRDKSRFQDYLLSSSQPVQYRYEDVEYKITIREVSVFPQGYAAVLMQPDLLYSEPSVLLMDIGGWTVDLMRIDNGKPVAETCHSLELGIIRCMDSIREQVRSSTGLSVTDAQIQQVMDGRECSLNETVRSIIHCQTRMYTERLFAAAMEAGFDLQAIPVILMGGGSSVVMRRLTPEMGLCRAIPLTDDKLNAIGYETILGRLSNRIAKG